ncbi:PKD domain-containing protein [Solirubrum puertoriconensis]|uniref:PKD domain-containing protein n=1 Tax=Solirubrum puertoriconensis TaxID=1751427 RepID=UPI001365B26B|nr:PKD domain-containing protein [Solirubrum puertoriconensis]
MLVLAVPTLGQQGNPANTDLTSCYGSCTSNDFTITKAYLSDANGNPITSSACSGGGTVDAYLSITFRNNTSSDRNGIFISGRINGNYLAICFPGSLPKQTSTTYTYSQKIKWTCGTDLTLTDTFVGWGSASEQVCSLTCTQATPSKCRQVGNLRIVTPLIPDFTFSADCVSGNLFSTVSFNNSTTGGYGNYTYKWSFGDGSTSTQEDPSHTYTAAGLYNVELEITDTQYELDENGVPTSVVLSTEKETVTKQVNVVACCTPPTITTQPTAQQKCAGESASFSVASTGGVPAPTVQWQLSTDNGGSWNNLSNAAPYSGVTSTTLAISSITTSMNGYRYRAVLQSGACTAVNSDAAILSVDPTSVGGSVASSGTVCSGNNGGTLTLSGQTGTVVRWEASVNGGAYNAIPNTAGLTSYAYSNLTQTTAFRAVVQSGVCASANSSPATITVEQNIGNNIIGSAQTICTGSMPSSLTGSQPTGGSGGYTYQWQQKAAGDADFANIPGTNSQNYAPGALTTTTQFRRIVSGGQCAASTSDPITITVEPASVGGSVAGGGAACAGTNNGTLTLSGQTGTVVRWEASVNGGAYGAIANTAGLTSYSYSNLTQTTSFRAVVQSGSCAAANSSPATVTITPASVGGSVAGGRSVCAGSNSGPLTLSGQTGAVVRWESSVNGGAYNAIANTAGLTSYAYSNLTQTTAFRAVVQSGSCATVNSSPATITVNTCDKFCTLTQGGWGNSNGRVCNGPIRVDLITTLLRNGGDLTIGIGPNRINYSNTAAQAATLAACILKAMPAGGTAGTLPNVGQVSGCSLPGSLLKNDKFNNVLIGQVMALELNLRLDAYLSNQPFGSSNLGSLMLTSSMTTYRATTCGAGGVADPTDLTGITRTIPSSVINYLNTSGGGATVANLLKLGEEMLGGTAGSGRPSFADVNAAITAVNELFDNCRVLASPVYAMSAVSTTASLSGTAPAPKSLKPESGLSTSLYPNPASADATITFSVAKSGRAVVEVYNALGARVAKLYDAEVQAGEVKSVTLHGEQLPTGTYFYRVSTGEQSKTNRFSLVK